MHQRRKRLKRQIPLLKVKMGKRMEKRKVPVTKIQIKVKMIIVKGAILIMIVMNKKNFGFESSIYPMLKLKIKNN